MFFKSVFSFVASFNGITVKSPAWFFLAFSSVEMASFLFVAIKQWDKSPNPDSKASRNSSSTWNISATVPKTPGNNLGFSKTYLAPSGNPSLDSNNSL